MNTRLNLKPGVLSVIIAIVAASALGMPASGSATAPQPASGTFKADIDFDTLSLAPVGSNCVLQVDGELTFSGTLEGTAPGTTTALVFASCDEAATHPPGTFRDVFISALEFEGAVDGVPVTADVTYQGQVREGGSVDALIRVSNGANGVLEVEGSVAEGGSYSGSLRSK